MSDLIDRQMAIEAVEKTMVDMLEDYLCYDVVKVLKSIPSAEPKYGKWMKEDNIKNLGGYHRFQTHVYYTVYRCSNCLNIGGTDDRYCSKCGARMLKDE